MLIETIQSYLRVATSHQRDTEQIGSFLATFSRSNDTPFLNYAIPDDNATPSRADVAALIAAYEKRSRKPRLEYIPQLAPAVKPVLIDAGFCVEGHLPLMTCTPESAQSLPVPPGIELILPVSDADLLATVSVQNEAYGAPPPDSASMARLRNSLEAGGIAVLARIMATGEPVGAGVCTVPSHQTTEIAAIGVRAAFRRRGVAGSLTTRLVQEAFAAGVSLPFLMAAQEAEKRIYARAGFAEVGEILHISRPTK
ncbi:GNAT family N-acetyltransferase [Leptolyngbya sp. FACHB-261]|uniref:GNAT family N-acetyltransferase n=1 Tax=Leptolyngbya sp. FACHB-261 TaxID=2692806 RepID=UPI001689A900|nr:GNAT family N-acetyltransferase [Leptolyngbya sp. FACHB-261]MBD2099969.1 GNAT family N-acetyltransferase [Leptolyngbya sp. FACHB-261]